MASYTFSVPLKHAPAVQFLVKKHNLRFKQASSFADQFYCTVSAEHTSMEAYNGFCRDWEQLERELKNEVTHEKKSFWRTILDMFRK